jgi:hypothetical protein
MSDPLDSMLDLMRRLPPTQVEENVSALVDICPDYADDLLGSVDQPLKVRTDTATGKEYLTCDYNRDGDSYRYVWSQFHMRCSCRALTHVGTIPSSPWSNEYDPPLDDGTVPSVRLRKLEIAANEAFDTYREMYANLIPNVIQSPLTPDTLTSYPYLRLPGTMKVASHQYTSGTWTMGGSPELSCSRRVRYSPPVQL